MKHTHAYVPNGRGKRIPLRLLGVSWCFPAPPRQDDCMGALAIVTTAGLPTFYPSNDAAWAPVQIIRALAWAADVMR